MRAILMVTTLVFASGCAGAVVTYPRVENPVLLGPVDRVGGAPQARKSETNASFDAVLWFTVFSQSGFLFFMAARTWPGEASVRVLQADLARTQDVHITKVRATGYVLDVAGAFSMDNDLHVELEIPKKEGTK